MPFNAKASQSMRNTGQKLILARFESLHLIFDLSDAHLSQQR
jgi:hypothetical protein